MVRCMYKGTLYRTGILEEVTEIDGKFTEIEEGVTNMEVEVNQPLTDEVMVCSFTGDTGRQCTESTQASKRSVLKVYQRKGRISTAFKENLAPVALMHPGPMLRAQYDAKNQGKMLVVIVQPTKESGSVKLNLEAKEDHAIAQAIRSRLILIEVGAESEDGKWLRDFYRLRLFPATVVI